MKSLYRRIVKALVGPALTVIALAVVAGPAVAGPASGTSPDPAATPGRAVANSCTVAAAGHARCMSLVRQPVPAGTRTSGPSAQDDPLPPGALAPADLVSAYHLGGAPAPGTTVAIVDAYGYPKAESDLAVFRSRFGLGACTTANGCFTKVNQQGARSPLPAPDAGWGLETALDLQTVSAVCPTCHLLLVEGNSNLGTSLAAAVNTAVRLGAHIVSNSYGIDESTQPNQVVHAYTGHPGVSMVASTGDYGFGPASMPAAYANVIAVGGTSLTRAPSTARGWAEAAWSGAGSGCSAYVAKPAWQKDGHCAMRTVADISAVSDPDTDGLYIYDTYQLPTLGLQNGWLVGGGTSQAAPLISAVIARSGRVLGDANWIYAHRSALFDPTGGSNGFCGHDYLCTGRPGYDGPTGVGSPNGVAAL